jgi:dolichol-phosphate mannosyltransferase
MANEEADFRPFVDALREMLDYLPGGCVYFVVDGVSRDRTLDLCRALEERDSRFVTIWAPENRNVVDAYLRGIREACDRGHQYIIEMDAGLSHDPRAIPMFLRVLNEGNECAFGSRYINGGSMTDSPLTRRILSKGGSWLSRWLLGVHLHDLTSGFQGFHRSIALRLLGRKFQSHGHFYQTEVRYLLRYHRNIEVPIHYRAPSPRVSGSSIMNSIKVLTYYSFLRLVGRAPAI